MSLAAVRLLIEVPLANIAALGAKWTALDIKSGSKQVELCTIERRPLTLAATRRATMNPETCLLACQTPRKRQWQLGKLPPDEGTMLLIGWRLFPFPVDGGVPQPVASILAAAVSSAAKVSFPSVDLAGYNQRYKNVLPETTITLLENNGMTEGIKFLLNGAPRTISLLTTTDAATLTHMFNDSAFAWHMQGQIALLCPADGNVPVLSREELLSLIGDEWVRHTAELRQRGIIGAIRPGVDGDVLGVHALDEQFAATLMKALEYEAHRAGIEWRVVTEDVFTDMLSG